MQRRQPALVVRGHRDGLEDPLDLVLAEAVGQQPLVRARLDERLGARAGGHALGAHADQPARSRFAGDRGAEQRVDLLGLDAADRRRLVLRVAGLDVHLGAARALAVAHLLGDVLRQCFRAERALAEHDLADRVVDDLLEAAHVRALLMRAEVDEAVQAGGEQLFRPVARIRMTFSTLVTPTRERHRESVGTRLWTSSKDRVMTPSVVREAELDEWTKVSPRTDHVSRATKPGRQTGFP